MFTATQDGTQMLECALYHNLEWHPDVSLEYACESVCATVQAFFKKNEMIIFTDRSVIY